MPGTPHVSWVIMYGDVETPDREFACQSEPRTECIVPASRPDNKVFSDVHIYYHGAGDEWPKIDFANMERTARMVGAALLMIADATTEPRWRPGVEEAAPYRAAWERLHGGGS